MTSMEFFDYFKLNSSIKIWSIFYLKSKYQYQSVKWFDVFNKDPTKSILDDFTPKFKIICL